ncbi:chitin synthase-domain-containing protein [Gorgonomyces haynaldii]|nr:chitin synthase-domain-containing protein [Gorgonomyces haynaldii]
MTQTPCTNTYCSPLQRRPTRTQTVKALQGRFVLQVPIATELLKDAQYTTDAEFTHMSYTAVTTEPDAFTERYTLRQKSLNRKTKIALVVTMYNEDDHLFVKSLLAVQKNIAYLCSEECPYSWGPNGWQNFVVVIVSDGAAKINPRVKTVLGVMGLWVNDQFIRTSVNEEPVTAHLFELTTQVAVDRDFNIRTRKEGICPTQIVFLLKQKNAKKINSHKWFFDAVCETLDPEVVMLLDVGTKPSETSFYELYRAFERDPNVGGACGEIIAEAGKFWQKIVANPLVASQNFEYKMSNILDKPLESIFGYISVLPGAFSAYRYTALKGRPLQQYFKGEKPAEKDGHVDLFTSNLYLAEDRILCFELVAKKKESWILKYVKSARGETDVPDKLPELISQRRRWLNGSFFAALHALINYPQIWSSGHSFYQKVLFSVEFFYNAINLLFSWFSIANFYLAFFFLFKGLADADTIVRKPGEFSPDPFAPYGQAIFDVTREIYICGIVLIVISAMGNRPQGSKWLYYSVSVLFGVLMALMVFLGGWSIYLASKSYVERETKQSFFEYFRATPTFRDLVVATASTYGVYLVSSIIHLDPWHVFNSMIQYLFMLPTYTNLFMIYSFCNLHDVSWGTKGDNTMTVDAKPANAQKNDKGETVFAVELPDGEEETSEAWKSFNKQLAYNRDHEAVDDSKPNMSVIVEDNCKEFRTKVVLFWMFCNAALVVIATNNGMQSYLGLLPKEGTNNSVSPYLTFLFWTVAFFALVRFIGSCLFMAQWWKEKVADAASAPRRHRGEV